MHRKSIAIELARYASPKGSQIHFELSERCEAWNLPFVREFLDELQLRKVTCHGCTVGLRANDTGDLLCKGWSIASRNNNLLRHLHLPCQKNHKKVPCESGRPAKTAFYTPVFVKKVIEALRQCESWSLVTSELQELPTIQKPVDTTEECQVQDVEVSAEEKLRITKLLKHIHSTTGHGSIDTLVDALRRRGVPDHVLAIARNFRCAICDERKRVAPSRLASLEVVPLKWQVVQCDLGSWHHPITKDKVKFLLMVDEGSRFRIGRILFENSRSQATWNIVQQCFEEHWLATFGKPEVIRVDPEGVWRDEQAEAYCRERGIELSPIPAEAHWQIGIVENAIKSQKTCHDLIGRRIS